MFSLILENNNKNMINNSNLTSSFREYFNEIDLIIKDEKKLDNFINKFRLKDSVFVFDFDGTVTEKGQHNSFSPVNYFPGDTEFFMDEVKKYYLPIERARSFDSLQGHLKEEDKKLIISQNLSFEKFFELKIIEWWKITMDFAIKNNITNDNIKSYLGDVYFRKGMKELIEKLISKNIDVMIVSAGVKNFIDDFMEMNGFNLASHKLHIVGNTLISNKDGLFIGYDEENIITSINKKHINYEKYGVHHKDFAVQFGDSIGDYHMVNDHFEESKILTIGFTNGDEKKKDLFSETFDITYTGNSAGVDNLIKLFNI